jgi:hypothetical protein
MPRPTHLLIALALAVGVAACGEDEAPPRAAAPAGDPERYCALARQLDADGEQFFSKLGEDATPKQYETAERRFIERSQAKLAELERVAPEAIGADVRVLLAGMRQRAGLAGPEVSESKASAADERVQDFEAANCDA